MNNIPNVAKQSIKMFLDSDWSEGVYWSSLTAAGKEMLAVSHIAGL